MARSENPIPAASGALGELARRLRYYRDRAGRTYRQLDEMTHFSYSQLSRAANGKDLPTWDVTEAFLRGCGITGSRSIEVLRRLWEHAARGRRTIRPPRWSQVPLGQVQTRAEFAKQLQALAYRDTGWISVRDIALLTDQPRSNVADWLSGKTMPQQAALDQFATLLGATGSERADLRDARSRVLVGAKPATTAGIQVLDELESSVDEETFLQALLTVVDGTVTVDHPAEQEGQTAERRFVRRRAAGTPTWVPGDSDRVEAAVRRVRSIPALPRPRESVAAH